MVVDKIGGVGPGYGPKKTEPQVRNEAPARSGDKVTISDEAARAASLARVQKLAQTEDTSRNQKLDEIREKLARGD